MNTRMRAAVIAAALLLACGTALAAAPKWSELTPAQQAVLESVHDRWDTLPEARRETLLRGAQRCRYCSGARNSAKCRLTSGRWSGNATNNFARCRRKKGAVFASASSNCATSPAASRRPAPVR